MDKIADMFSSIQNAHQRGKSSVILPSSRMAKNILNVLYVEGYIKGYSEVGLISVAKPPKPDSHFHPSASMALPSKSKKKTSLVVSLGYAQGSLSSNPKIQESSIHKILRLSRPGKRLYIQSSALNKVKRGLGSLLLSTSRGIMCDRDARFLGIGGEVLCQIY
jgi:small subunit ribosomal protein S8